MDDLPPGGERRSQTSSDGRGALKWVIILLDREHIEDGRIVTGSGDRFGFPPGKCFVYTSHPYFASLLAFAAKDRRLEKECNGMCENCDDNFRINGT